MYSFNTLIEFLLVALLASLTVATPVQLTSHAQMATPAQLASRSQVVNGWFYWYFGDAQRGALVVGFTSKQCQPVAPGSHGAFWVSPGKPGETDPAQCRMNDKPDCAGRWSKPITSPGGKPKIHGKKGKAESFMCDCGDKCVVLTDIATEGPLAPPPDAAA